MKKIVWVVLFVFFVLFTITLLLKNSHKVDVNYYFDIKWQIHIVVLLMGTFFSGLTLGLIVMYWSVLKQKMRFSAEHKKLAKVEKEVENLRAMPLKDEV